MGRGFSFPKKSIPKSGLKSLYFEDFRTLSTGGGYPPERRDRMRAEDYPLAGAFNPISAITICRSFQASPFCRGSRSRNAGW